MKVIITHVNADFDGLASMVAASKIYPGARMIFPGSMEKSMRDFSSAYHLVFDKIKDIDLDAVDTLILVDTKNPRRIGRFSEIVKRDGLKMHIYDHHPPSDSELHGEVEVLDDIGATTTLLVEILKKKRIPITPFEATILALGIYEETGSLTFPSTKDRDLMAASYLLKKGADLNVVSSYITRDLSPDEISLLDELLHSARDYYIEGVKVAVATASCSKFIGEMASVVHKLRDMENIDVLFAIVNMADTVQMVARSRREEIDVGEIASEFGGGGHRNAASASIKDLTIIQVEERLLEILKEKVRHKVVAREIMTSPLKTIEADKVVTDAEGLMTRYGVNVLPVLDNDRFLGLMTREVIQKSIFHGLSSAKVRELMQSDVYEAAPDTPFRDIESKMIELNQRFVPVVEEGRIIGGITRTDLLRTLHDDIVMKPSLIDEEGEHHYTYSRNLRSVLSEKLPVHIDEMLRGLGSVADEMDVSAYVVGGFVRDLLMGQTNLDLDIVIEGDGIAFANTFAERHSARIKSHHRFGTAVIVFQDGFKLDVATARMEYYEYPTALPTVERASIKKDLYRRDFTINTLAIKLNKRNYGNLTDFFGGQRDIKEKTIKVLHNLSFIEDPTRVFRAIRFEQRFNFRIGKYTQNLIKSAVKMELFHRLSGHRLFDELVLIFSEPDPIRAVRRMNEFDLIKFIHPRIRLTTYIEALFSNINDVIAWHKLLYLDKPVINWQVYFMGLLDELGKEYIVEVCRRLTIPGQFEEKIIYGRDEIKRISIKLYRQKNIRPSEIYHLLKPVSIELLILMMAKAKEDKVKKAISLYLANLQGIKTSITGSDLKRIGLAPGPLFKEIMGKVLDARLDGDVRSREEELSLAKVYKS
ncbi:MAG: CBS domain-containing protein [Nitrospirae bacterium]|nr:CBS domain-containing protein [Nitrospirota bacterium]